MDKLGILSAEANRVRIDSMLKVDMMKTPRPRTNSPRQHIISPRSAKVLAQLPATLPDKNAAGKLLEKLNALEGEVRRSETEQEKFSSGDPSPLGSRKQPSSGASNITTSTLNRSLTMRPPSCPNSSVSSPVRQQSPPQQHPSIFHAAQPPRASGAHLTSRAREPSGGSSGAASARHVVDESKTLAERPMSGPHRVGPSTTETPRQRATRPSTGNPSSSATRRLHDPPPQLCAHASRKKATGESATPHRSAVGGLQSLGGDKTAARGEDTHSSCGLSVYSARNEKSSQPMTVPAPKPPRGGAWGSAKDEIPDGVGAAPSPSSPPARREPRSLPVRPKRHFSESRQTAG